MLVDRFYENSEKMQCLHSLLALKKDFKKVAAELQLRSDRHFQYKLTAYT